MGWQNVKKNLPFWVENSIRKIQFPILVHIFFFTSPLPALNCTFKLTQGGIVNNHPNVLIVVNTLNLSTKCKKLAQKLVQKCPAFFPVLTA
jgi:hypothetical protein